VKRLTDADLTEIDDVRMIVTDILLVDLRRYKTALEAVEEVCQSTQGEHFPEGALDQINYIVGKALADDEEEQSE